MNHKKTKGFTMIELIVVLAIIALLVALVLVSLSMARNNAGDVRIKSDLSQLRKVAESQYDDVKGSFTKMRVTGTGSAGTAEKALFDDIVANGSTASNSGWSISANYPTVVATSWCASARLSNGKFWCVDTTGISVEQTTSLCAGSLVGGVGDGLCAP